MHLSPPPPPPNGLGCRAFLSGGSIVVNSLFIVAPIVCGDSVFGACFVIRFFMYYQFFLNGRRELDSRCLVAVSVLWLFLMVP